MYNLSMPILSAVTRALRDLSHPQVLAVLFLPMLGAIVLWSVLGWIFWDAWTGWFESVVGGTGVARWLAARGAGWVLESLTPLFVVVLLLPAMFVTAMLITELVAMPVVVRVVGRRYPALDKKAGGTIAGSIVNAVVAVVSFALLWLVTLPLWLTGVGAVVLPALNSAYLNQRLFRYDALSEHASAAEYKVVVARARRRLFALGLVLALLYYVPVVNFVAPVVSGLAFTHFCLAELATMRASEPSKHGEPKEGRLRRGT